mgnify:CR=1 FL=1
MLYDKPAPKPEPVSALLEENKRALDAFIATTSSRKEVNHFGILKERQASRSRRNLQRYKGLGSYKQRKTPECPCGRHQGIEFINDKEERIDHLCPKHWWVMQTWIAMDDKKIGAFVDSTPLAWYLEKYKKEE